MATSIIKREFMPLWFSFESSVTEDAMFTSIASTIARISDGEAIPINAVWQDHDYYTGIAMRKWSALRIIVANGSYLYLVTANANATPPTISSKKRVAFTAY